MRASLNQDFTLDDKCCLLFLLLKTQIGVLKDVKEEIRRMDRKSRKDLNLKPSVFDSWLFGQTATSAAC